MSKIWPTISRLPKVAEAVGEGTFERHASVYKRRQRKILVLKSANFYNDARPALLRF